MSSGKKEKPTGGDGGGRKLSGKKSKTSSEQIKLTQESTKNSNKEEQSLKEKIKWVMEATAKSEDEACTALHDTDYDPEKAVDLLIEGKAQEWSYIKKKTRGNGGGNGYKGGPTRKVTNDQVKKGTGEPDYEWQENESALLGVKGARGGRGGKPATGTWRGASGQGWKGKENKDNQSDRGQGGRGGWRGGVNGTTRQMEQGRHQRRPSPSESEKEDSQPFRRNQLVFVNKNFVAWSTLPPTGLPSLLAQARIGSSSQADDYDYEEYTGSLADSKVFTSSIQKPPPPTSFRAESQSSAPSQTTSPLPRPSRPTYADLYRNHQQQQVVRSTKPQQQHSQHPPPPLPPNPSQPSYQQQKYQPVRYQIHHQPPAIELGNYYY